VEKVATADADVLVYRTGDLSDALLSALLAATGLGVFQVSTFLPPDRWAAVGLLALVSLGLILGGAAGLARALVRSGITFDRAAGTVTVWRGTGLLLSRSIHDLAAFHAVLLSPARVQKRYTVGMVYLVGLHADVGEPVPLHGDNDYRAARQFAEEVADFLRLPLTDASRTETAIARNGQPGGLTPSIALVPRPAEMHCRVSWHGTTLIIEEPPPRWRAVIGRPLTLFTVLGIAALAMGVMEHFFGTPRGVNLNPIAAAAIVVAMLLVIFVAAVLGSLPQLYRRHVVRADATSLRFSTESPFATTHRSIRSQDVVELRVALGHLAVVTPRDWSIVCGQRDHLLPRAELEWLREQLILALQGSPAHEGDVPRDTGIQQLGRFTRR
jgi:hypothetical protein